jgi:hypothetical protein
MLLYLFCSNESGNFCLVQISGREMFYFNPDLAAADQFEEGDEAFESYNLEEEDGQNSVEVLNFPFIHSFHWHMQNATIPCRSQELLPFLSVMYFFLPSFSTNYSSILSHLILPSGSWFTSQSCCSQILI